VSVTGRRPARFALDGHREGRARAQIFGDAIEDHAHRKAVIAQHFDPLADLEDDTAVRGEHPRLLAQLRAGGWDWCVPG
jgi:hypothetical protein